MASRQSPKFAWRVQKKLVREDKECQQKKVELYKQFKFHNKLKLGKRPKRSKEGVPIEFMFVDLSPKKEKLMSPVASEQLPPTPVSNNCYDSLCKSNFKSLVDLGRDCHDARDAFKKMLDRNADVKLLTPMEGAKMHHNVYTKADANEASLGSPIAVQLSSITPPSSSHEQQLDYKPVSLDFSREYLEQSLEQIAQELQDKALNDYGFPWI